jgi:glycerol-3-phosphate dehydrogenase
MDRDLSRLSAKPFDLVVIGGGITGAFTAWDAALRGLTVALIERGDFGGATSAASSKVIHGGIRHLQKGEIGRVRESIRERATFLRIAPHLVHRVPFLVPTYGHGMRGQEVLRAGMLAYEVLSAGQNRHLADPERRIARHTVLSRRETLALEPALDARGLTGSVRYDECHMMSSERMTLAVIRAAAAAGAVVANYVEAESFLRQSDGGSILGVRARDRLAPDAQASSLDVRGAVVANITGPWALHVLARLDRRPLDRLKLAKGCHLVTRAITRSGALALATHHRNEGVVSRGGRHFFVIPWRGLSLIGTTNVPYAGDPAGVGASETDVADFVAEIAAVYPAAGLRREDVRHAFAGLYPLVDKEVRSEVYQGGSQYEIEDHAREGIDGLITVIGAKYTTARNLAEQAVDLVFRKRGRTPPAARTATTPLPGGNFARAAELRTAAKQADEQGPRLGEEVVSELLRAYGSEYPAVMRRAAANAGAGARVAPDRPTIRAMVEHAVDVEMARRLPDVIFRRTGLGTIGHPGAEALRACAAIMAATLGWDERRVAEEMALAEAPFHRSPA